MVNMEKGESDPMSRAFFVAAPTLLTQRVQWESNLRSYMILLNHSVRILTVQPRLLGFREWRICQDLQWPLKGNILSAPPTRWTEAKSWNDVLPLLQLFHHSTILLARAACSNVSFN